MFTAKKSVTINAPITKVWDALINPAMIKQYLFGTDAVSDWKVGSSLIFQGEWEGKAYKDKGVILKNEPEKVLQYSYWRGFSGLADIPENYQTITFELSENNHQVVLNITQENAATQEMADHSGENWKMVLDTLKNLLEK